MNPSWGAWAAQRLPPAMTAAETNLRVWLASVFKECVVQVLPTEG